MCRGVSSRAEPWTELQYPPRGQQDRGEGSTRALVQIGAETPGQVRRGRAYRGGRGWSAEDLLPVVNTACLQVL